MTAKTGRKPIGAVAMTAAQRKAEQVIRMEEAIQENDSSEWIRRYWRRRQEWLFDAGKTLRSRGVGDVDLPIES